MKYIPKFIIVSFSYTAFHCALQWNEVNMKMNTKRVTFTYNDIIYNNRREMKEALNWSTSKWNAKYKEGKIKMIKLKLLTEELPNENLHYNS